MDTVRRIGFLHLISICLLSFTLLSCAKSGEQIQKEIKRSYFETDKGVSIPKEVYQQPPRYTPPPLPEFRPLVEDVTPLKNRMVEISVRGTPLRDVLYVIAQVCGLNLIFEKGVDTEIPITVNLRNVTAEYALNSILSSTDYFYSLKGQTLLIKPEETRFFELNFPAVTQTYGVDVGGDILGAATAGAGSSIRGNVIQGIKGDEAGLNFWTAVEEGLRAILGSGPGAGGSVIVNKASGTVQVTTTRKKMELVEQFIARIKETLNRQVIIEAKVLEVDLKEGFSYGIDWSYLASGLDLRTENFSSVISSTSPATRLEGLKIFGTGSSLQSIVRAIEQQGEVRTLSSPRLNIMNGQTALLTVGTNQTYLSRVETTTTTAAGAAPTTTFTVQTSSILSGILIGIVPFVNEMGEITLSITPIISDLVSLNPKTIGTQLEISLPTVELRQLSTSVKARDGETIVLGGLISQKEKMHDSQVPLLGKVPLLGMLFKSRDKSSRKTEMVVLLKPMLATR